LETNCRLVFFGEQSERFVKNKQTQVAFADGYPLLLIHQTTLDQLNTRIGAPVSAFALTLLLKATFHLLKIAGIVLK